ncbi:DUF5132 domain-containing protein [Streptomyces sp. AJS327]|uniref:DUF5132 domain-containing protein n=1 Tax=Streptomyces sp. AJS327 TaxID=2545265 RepID=UPI002155869A|nr:DUF5132 domain-containing protein [Streptomyces sp. AJS327]
MFKTSVKIAVDAKRAAHQMTEELQDIAAEASAEAFVSEATATEGQGTRKAPPKARAATVKS